MNKLIRSVLLIYALLAAYNVISGFLGVPFQEFFTPLLTLIAFAFAVLHGSQRLGWGRALLLLGLTFTISLLFESLGVATGWVYGPYHYTDQLGPKFLGLVPYLIPAAWFMMMYPSYVIATRILHTGRGSWLWGAGVAAAGGLAMTAWDLAMDPLMVGAGHWVWEVQGAYFGVPLQNYWGWWLTSFVTFLCYTWLSRDRGRQPNPAADERLAIASYAISGLSTVMFDLQKGLGGAALAGLLAMLPWVVMGWASDGRRLKG